jgi:phage host-nuclease inhibitor protein Gam
MPNENKKPPGRRRPKITAAALVLTSEDAMVGTLNRYVELKLSIAAAATAHEKEVAELNSAFDDAIQENRQELAMLESSVQLFCVNHREALFAGERKSKEFANATVGFRSNPPSVGKRISKDTFEAIALRMNETEWGEPYVVWTAALDKPALLRDRAQLTELQLREAGLRFESDEFFFIEPSSDAIARSKATISEIKEVAAA